MRHFGKSWSGRRTLQGRPPPQQDVPEARAKSSGHGKKTADKWNQ
jgi:hypothetical protein